MRIEVDQSGKIEQFNMNTIIALSNGYQYSIMLSKSVKEKVQLQYKKRVKNLHFKIFCIGVYYCLRSYLHECPLIILDIEYAGKENLIKSILLDYIRKSHVHFDARNIRFGHVGKESNAHAVAIDVLRENRKPNKVISYEEVNSLLEK